MRRFFWAPKTYAKNYGYENIYYFTLKIFVYLNLWIIFIAHMWRMANFTNESVILSISLFLWKYICLFL